jgi:hypothetical protein
VKKFDQSGPFFLDGFLPSRGHETIIADPMPRHRFEDPFQADFVRVSAKMRNHGAIELPAPAPQVSSWHDRMRP